jgi:hypothetical protein
VAALCQSIGLIDEYCCRGGESEDELGLPDPQPGDMCRDREEHRKQHRQDGHLEPGLCVVLARCHGVVLGPDFEPQV